MRNSPPAFATGEIGLHTSLAVAETVANAMCGASPNTTVLLGFDNLVHFLDWLDAEQVRQNITED